MVDSELETVTQVDRDLAKHIVHKYINGNPKSEDINQIARDIAFNRSIFRTKDAVASSAERLMAFVYSNGPSLCPYSDHNGFDLHHKMREDIRLLLNMYTQSDMPVREAQRDIIPGLLSQIPDQIEGAEEETKPDNLRWMLTQVADEINVFPVDKQGRWIGFVQGVLALAKCLSVSKERDRTRPFFQKAYRQTGQAIPETKSFKSE